MHRPGQNMLFSEAGTVARPNPVNALLFARANGSPSTVASRPAMGRSLAPLQESLRCLFGSPCLETGSGFDDAYIPCFCPDSLADLLPLLQTAQPNLRHCHDRIASFLREIRRSSLPSSYDVSSLHELEAVRLLLAVIKLSIETRAAVLVGREVLRSEELAQPLSVAYNEEFKELNALHAAYRHLIDEEKDLFEMKRADFSVPALQVADIERRRLCVALSTKRKASIDVDRLAVESEGGVVRHSLERTDPRSILFYFRTSSSDLVEGLQLWSIVGGLGHSARQTEALAAALKVGPSPNLQPLL